MMNIVQYSVVIPIYNSSNSLLKLNQELAEVLNSTNSGYEIIFVDDCSNDNSWEKLSQICSSDNNVRIIRLANNVGQWMATLCGMRHAQGKYIITIDDDLEYNSKDILKLIDCICSNDYHIVYGIPLGKARKNLTKQLFYNWRIALTNFLFNKNNTESFKILKREVLFQNDSGVFPNMHFEAYAKFAVAQNHVGYIEVDYGKGVFKSSRHSLLKKIKIITKYGWEYYKNPFKMIGYFGLFLLLIGLYNLFSPGYKIFQENISTILFVGGFSNITIAMLGKYLSYLYLAKKGFPNYVVIEKK